MPGVSRRSTLKTYFALILLGMVGVTVLASNHQALWDWQGLVREPDRWWTFATLADAYFGFLTFYAWVFYKEIAPGSRAAWFLAIMLLGNIAMSVYMLRELSRLRDDEPLESLLLRRNR